MSLIYLFIYLITYLLQGAQTFREANRISASQEFAYILLNPKVFYRIHKCPPPVPILSRLDPGRTTISYFLKIHIINILPSTLGFPKWLEPSTTHPHIHKRNNSTFPTYKTPSYGKRIPRKHHK